MRVLIGKCSTARGSKRRSVGSGAAAIPHPAPQATATRHLLCINPGTALGACVHRNVVLARTCCGGRARLEAAGRLQVSCALLVSGNCSASVALPQAEYWPTPACTIATGGPLALLASALMPMDGCHALLSAVTTLRLVLSSHQPPPPPPAAAALRTLSHVPSVAPPPPSALRSENAKLRRTVQSLQEAEGRAESRCREALARLKGIEQVCWVHLEKPGLPACLPACLPAVPSFLACGHVVLSPPLSSPMPASPQFAYPPTRPPLADVGGAGGGGGCAERCEEGEGCRDCAPAGAGG